jgi:uncharacterized protein YndB with AHSA1/START domain
MTTPETTYIAEPGGHAVTVSAVIAAPLDAVYRSYVEPEQFVRWWGPAELQSKIDRWEPVTGGAWRVVHVDPDGNEYAFSGVYHEVVPSERVVLTFEYEGMPGHVCFERHTFESVDGGTRSRSTRSSSRSRIETGWPSTVWSSTHQLRWGSCRTWQAASSDAQARGGRLIRRTRSFTAVDARDAEPSVGAGNAATYGRSGALSTVQTSPTQQTRPAAVAASIS